MSYKIVIKPAGKVALGVAVMTVKPIAVKAVSHLAAKAADAVGFDGDTGCAARATDKLLTAIADALIDSGLGDMTKAFAGA